MSAKNLTITTYFQFLTLADKLLIAIFLLAGFLSLVVLHQLRQQGNCFSVSMVGSKEQFYSLDKNQQLAFAGALGTTIVQVKNKQVRVLASPCPEKICIKSGWIQRTGDILVCVPNKIVIRINGKQNGQFDVITQ